MEGLSERIPPHHCQQRTVRTLGHTGGMTSETSKTSETTVSATQGRVILAATPIGNVADASTRLVELLQTADIVAAEDTRRLYDLANRLGIRVGGRVVAYHDHNEHEKAEGLLDDVAAGATVVVVSDAGMPTINDPGLTLVRHAIDRGLPVTCAPGPSAVLDALALSGLPTDRFCFEGFVPRKHSERLQRFRMLAAEQRTIVFYETPHRIAETMDDMAEIFPADRPLVLARELTKNFEEVRRSTVSGVRDSVRVDPPRGEIVLVLQGASTQELRDAAESRDAVSGANSLALTPAALAELAQTRAEEQGLKIKVAIGQVVAEHPLPDGSLVNKKEVYSAVVSSRSMRSSI